MACKCALDCHAIIAIVFCRGLQSKIQFKRFTTRSLVFKIGQTSATFSGEMTSESTAPQLL